MSDTTAGAPALPLRVTEEIYQRVWGYAMAHGDRCVDVFVHKLRAKLQRASPDRDDIHTHFGVGYRFAAAWARDGAQTAPAEALAARAGDAGADPGLTRIV